MRYLGGKAKIGKRLGAFLNAQNTGNRPFYAPFVGAANVTQHIIAPRRYASDANDKMIALWSALQRGWQPPDAVSEAEYYHIRATQGQHLPELEAFVLIGCSFGGKWADSYARCKRGKNYASMAKQSLLKKIKNLQDVRFIHADIFTIEPPEDNMLIYCDPPYASTVGYKATGGFDNAAFWDKVRRWTSEGHRVFVSEYQAPDDFTCVWSVAASVSVMSNKRPTTKTERLFTLDTSGENG